MFSLILHGRRSTIELQKKWGILSVSVKLLQNEAAFSNSFSSASAANGSPRGSLEGQGFTVSYLVGSLGLSTKLAESISRKVNFEEKGNPDSVLSLLRSHGFTDTQISSIITIYPQLLIADAEKSLGPKLAFLQSRGGTTSDITKVISTVPKILGRKDNKSISAYYDLVKSILKEEEQEADDPMTSPQENKIRNVSALRGLGVPQRLLFSVLNQPVYGKEKFEESLNKVVEMGFVPTSSKFLQALNVVYGLSDKTIQEKLHVYKSLGLTVDDVWEMFKRLPLSLAYSEKKITHKFETLKKCGLLEDEVLLVLKKYPQCIGISEQNILNSVDTFVGLGFSRDEFAMMIRHKPQCLNYSAETVKKKTEFLVKEMNWPLKAVVSNPAVLGYSLEKRTVPRCDVIKALIFKGLIGNELPPMSYVLVCTDETFLKRYVKKHDDDMELVAELMVIFTRKMRKTDKAS